MTVIYDVQNNTIHVKYLHGLQSVSDQSIRLKSTLLLLKIGLDKVKIVRSFEDGYVKKLNCRLSRSLILPIKCVPNPL